MHPQCETLPPIVVIGGPTASGKSALALALAKRIQTEGHTPVILNADALQLYRDLRVLTARPSREDEALAPHRLYGVLDGAVRGSVAQWLEMIQSELTSALDCGSWPLVVGGTGMYLNALLNGLAIVPEITPTIRAQAVTLHAELGGTAFRSELAKLDPVAAARLHDGDTQRLIRAYEVITGTGRTLEAWQNDKQIEPPAAWRFKSFVVSPSRPLLYANCDLRFDLMLEKGAMEEVRQLLTRQLDPDLPVMKAVGVPELAAVLKGQSTIPEAREKAQQTTRNYAKRQLTWFRHQLPSAMHIEHDKPGNEKENCAIASSLYSIICKSG